MQRGHRLVHHTVYSHHSPVEVITEIIASKHQFQSAVLVSWEAIQSKYRGGFDHPKNPIL